MAWASTAGFHHGIVKDDVAGGGQVQAGAGGAQAQQEDRRHSDRSGTH